MKLVNKSLVTGLLLMLTSLVLFAQNKPEKASIKVYGNCGMCKTRIENALDLKGVKSADWNIQTKQLEIVYVPAKISLEQIHAAIAGAGHDTELKKAEDTIYKQLPDCCLYRENPNTHTD